jgi:hypothetical protein
MDLRGVGMRYLGRRGVEVPGFSGGGPAGEVYVWMLSLALDSEWTVSICVDLARF